MISSDPPAASSATPTGSIAREKAYVRAVERRFLALRESGLYLSPKDFALLLDWFERGVPAELVISAIEALFSKAAARSESRKIQSIAYCRRAVEEAWEERRAALLGPAPAAPSAGKGAFTPEEIAVHLDLAAAATRAAGDRIAAACAEVAGGMTLQAIAAELIRLKDAAASGVPVDLRNLEDVLVALESESVRIARASMAQPELAALESETEQSLAALMGRMSVRAREATLRRAFDAAIRRRFDLPRYSLFTMAR